MANGTTDQKTSRTRRRAADQILREASDLMHDVSRLELSYESLKEIRALLKSSRHIITLDTLATGGPA